ncbi:sugar transferase [Novosphingobium sp.]|uniref:sugar transferase n=1 Tax=Novosphingobium sp. TaxID=1874826 RepID=UPI002C52D173|nr:sugar transferase [Novosphingobium sp.]HQV05065.1 sugar transferase [Novosphingobium sp.]
MTTINTEAVVSASASAHTPESVSVPAPTHVSDYSAAGRADWQRRYQRKLIISDLVVTVLAVEMAQWVRFGTGFVAPSTTPVFENYLVASAALAACWLAMLAAFNTRSVRVIGSGVEEYRRVATSGFALFGFVAIVSLLFQLDLARIYLATAFPLGIVGLLLSRRVWRSSLSRARAKGDYQARVLVVGSLRAVRDFVATIDKEPSHGYDVVAACVTNAASGPQELSCGQHTVPVLGNENDVIDAIEQTGADTLAVANAETYGIRGMRDLVWQIEPYEVDLVVAPGVVDVAGPRLAMTPVAGLPLLHVERPQYHGAERALKRILDLTIASTALLVLSPLMIVTALAVKLTSPGPIIYKANRIGLNGEPFSMYKFRSMVQNADKQREDLVEQNEGAGPLFKMRDDPRITPVGKFIRRFSIDELPQLFNVLNRSMSVVGPRPPLAEETAAYDEMVTRRMLVRPGVTGLWQVSGRSDLSWEDSVRLDLYYIENWSILGDLFILMRTVRAVVSQSGAY